MTDLIGNTDCNVIIPDGLKADSGTEAGSVGGEGGLRVLLGAHTRS